jgi:plasmid stabilization system protein ParE
MPQRGRVVPEIGDGSYRELIFQNYRIVYRALSGRVIVIGVVNAAMDMERLAAERGWDIT